MVSYSLVQMPGPTLTVLPDTIQYYYYDDYVVVGLPIRRSVENSEQILVQNIFHSWFIFEKDSTWGYFFDSLSARNCKKMKVDSLLFSRAYAASFDLSKDTLIASINDKKSGTLVEKYVPKNNYRENYFDSAFYYYSQGMRHVKYSLSTQLDSLKFQKLFKVRILYKERYSQTYGTKIPKREFSFEIREMPFKDFGIDGLIQKLKGSKFPTGSFR